jgi:hypothetical protein
MSKKFIAFVLGAFVLAGGLFLWVLYGGSQLPLAGAPTANPAASPAPPAVPPPPSVTFTVRTSRSGNAFIVSWQNLPVNTVALNILRRLKNGTSPWTLWKQIQLSAGELGSGSASFDIGTYTYANYSFSVETVGNLTNSSGTTTGQTITWTSSSTTATITASSTTTETGTTNTTESNTTTTTTASSTTSTTTTSSTTTNTTSATTTTTAPAPSGTPYYNPQIQLSGYGSGQTGSFWVQYVDQKIQIGWQDLPASTTAIAVLRAADVNGPWSTILAQSNIDPTGPSTIQIVDDTLNQTSYYELDAKTGSTVIAVYGPVSLPPLSQ